MEFIKILVDPIGLFSLIILYMILRTMFSGKISWSALLLFLILFLLSSPAIVNPLLHQWESLVKADACPDKAQIPIVVLGGGLDSRARDPAEIEYLSRTSYVRVLGGLDVANAFPLSPVYLAGGTHYVVSEAQTMAVLARRLGFDNQRLILEDQSKNTSENALFMAKLLRINNEQGQVIRLITSASHMLRAKLAFERAGIEVCPIPVHKRALTSLPGYGYIPQVSVLEKSASLLHEVVGLAYYQLAGKL